MQATPESTDQIVARNFWWRFSNFIGSLMLVPQFLLPICCFYTPSDANAFYRKVTVTSIVLASACFVYEWYTFKKLFTITFPACFVSNLIGSLVMLMNRRKLKYIPGRWTILFGGIAFITMIGLYMHLRDICGTNSRGDCPLPTWFNHNACMHVALIPILWITGVGWAESEKEEKSIVTGVAVSTHDSQSVTGLI